jgi:uncharacterized membrane protein HdeD (DUF308 family)
MRVIEPKIDDRVVNFKWIVPLAILTIGLGIIAIVCPFFISIVSTLVFGWVFIVAGIAQIVYAFQSRGAGQVIWKLILGLLYLIAGFFVLANPLAGLLSFTFILGITIFVQGIIQVSMAFQVRRIAPNWGWMLASGLIGIIFGIIIWSDLSYASFWLIGTLIGVNLLFDGVWILMLHSGQRRALQ